MYSGNESTESQNYTQWPMNPASYHGVSNEQVDWAALAHEWIRMKEAGPPMPTEKLLPAPAAPIISGSHDRQRDEEGGEAPMEVENEWESAADLNYLSQAHQSWNWNNGSSTSNWPPIISSGANLGKAPLLPTPAYNYSPNSKDSMGSDHYNASGSGNYWSGNGHPANKLMKPHNKRYSKVNIASSTATSKQPPAGVNFGVVPTLDSNKRKQLPAWIREGLEKMERDKLKQMDKSRELSVEQQEANEKQRLRENAMEILKLTVKEAEELKEKTRLSAYVGRDEENSENDEDSDSKAPPAPRISSPEPLTHEEMMLKVRRTMTEILLKVTNREIQNICKEELQRHVRKQKASEQRVVSAPSGANLSAKLGLGAYGGGSDESSAESDQDEEEQLDSDQELKDSIKRREEEFNAVEKQIERKLATNDNEALKRGDEDSSPHSDRGHSPPIENKSAPQGKRRPSSATPPPPPRYNRRRRSSSQKKRSKNNGKSSGSSSRSRSNSSSSDRRGATSYSRKSERRRSRSHSRETRSRSRSPKRRRNLQRSPSPRRVYSSRRNNDADRRPRRRTRSRSTSRSASVSRNRQRRGGGGGNWRSRSRSPFSDCSSMSNKRRRRRSRSNSVGRGKRSSHRY